MNAHQADQVLDRLEAKYGEGVDASDYTTPDRRAFCRAVVVLADYYDEQRRASERFEACVD